MLRLLCHPQVYSSSVTPGVKRHCLSSIAKMLFFNQPATLQELTRDLPVACFLGALLRARDATVAAFGMQVGVVMRGSIVCLLFVQGWPHLAYR